MRTASRFDPWRPRAEHDEPQYPPGPAGYPLIGMMPEVWRDSLGMMIQGFQRFGETATFRFGPYRYVVANDPEDVRHVLVQNHANYHKSPTYAGLKLVLGNGLVTSEGSFWRRQRKLATPAFHRKRLVNFTEQMIACTEDTCARWSALPPGQELDVAEEMMKLTFRIVGHTLFSTELGGEADHVGEAMEVALKYANDAAESMMLIPTWLPTPKNQRFHRAKATLDELVLGMIAERRRQVAETGDAGHDLMAMLMEATDETGTERMSDEQLRDEVLTLVSAGHETTANALSWTFMLLSKYPDVARRLRAELDEVLGGRPPGFEDLPRLEYTERVIQESMRLYPPVWMIERVTLGPDVVAGKELPKDTIVAMCMYTAHRNPKYWPNPEGFDPDRFLPERSEDRPRYAYFPFGAGPRMCIGNHFAMMEAKLLVAMLIQRFDVELRPGHRVALDPGVTLRPKGGLPMRITPRRQGRRLERVA